MRKPLLAIILTTAGLSLAATATAAEVEHYQGKEAKTLEQAVTNLRDYNQRLEALLEKEDLTAAELEKVHQLTYTLENALKRINTELGSIAGNLETVHLASERRETETVRSKGRIYLQQVDTLID